MTMENQNTFERVTKEHTFEMLDLVPLGVRERVLFIGTQFSILYTSMYSPAEAATHF